MAARRIRICTLLLLALLLQQLPLPSLGAEMEAGLPTEETTLPAEEPTAPTGESPAPSEESPVSSEEPTAPSEESPVPSEEPTAPSEEFSAPTDPIAEAAAAEPPALEIPAGLYFGLLHGHTDLSDGLGTIEEAFAHGASTAGLDFLAITDHSNSLDGWENAAIGEDAAAVSTEWAAARQAAEAATTETFLALFGYEMTWREDQQLGHLNTFFTPGFQARDQAAYKKYGSALENYYDTLLTVPGSVSQFNHPGTQFGDFQDFGHHTGERDEAVQLLELGTGKNFCSLYDRALAQGWHVAPTCSQNSHFGAWGSESDCRTAVYAPALTEEGLRQGIQARRVYATEDRDLVLDFEIHGHKMGSRVSRLSLGSWTRLTATLLDPTDEAIGIVEVISGGECFASQRLDASQGTLTFELPTDRDHYYLRITQPDGDRAVSAPIWLEGLPGAGIASFTCDTPVPVQGREGTLTLTLFGPLTVERITLTMGESCREIPVTEEMTYTIPLIFNTLGTGQVTIQVEGLVLGIPQCFTQSLPLSVRAPEITAGILVDASHGNRGISELGQLIRLAAQGDMPLSLLTGELTHKALEGCHILILTAPERPFEEEFLSLVRDFSQWGGSVLICGGEENGELNRALAALGSSMALTPGILRDPVNNGGEETLLFTGDFNREASLWSADLSGQVYAHRGRGIDPGGGTWLVRAGEHAGSPVLLAEETLPGGGRLLLAASDLVTEAVLTLPQGIWAQPYANRTFLARFLAVHRETLPLTSIGEAAEPETAYRLRGYVTAALPEGTCIQDDTGAILISQALNLPLGTPVEVRGVLGDVSGNRALSPMGWEELDSFAYRYPPRTLPCGDFSQAEGLALIQLTGKVLSREGNSLILEDGTGNLRVCFDTLPQGMAQELRVTGLCWQQGEARVLRVFDPEMAVPIQRSPIRADPTNPKTGDPLGMTPLVLALSGLGLLLLKRRKY